MNINKLPVNYAPLQAISEPIPDASSLAAVIQELSAYLSPPINLKGIPQKNPLNASIQKKLMTIINCQLGEEQGRKCAIRTARYLGERCLKDLILHHQNPQQLSTDFFIALKARGCQFLGPAVQEEVLNLVLKALDNGSGLSRKALIAFILQRLHFPQASKNGVGNVVQLLYRASCFKISKRDSDSSLLYLKAEFRTYEALRRKHDSEMVKIATEAGLFLSLEQWSSLLYGDTAHSSHMQSVIDKLQTPKSFSQSIDELVIVLQRNGDPGNLFALKPHLEVLAGIDPDPSPPSWKDLNLALEAVKFVLKGVLDFFLNFGYHKVLANRQNLNTDVPCHAFNRLSISENYPFVSPLIDPSANSHFSNDQVNNACSLVDIDSLLDSHSPLQTFRTLNPEFPVFSPSVKLPRAILKQSSHQTLSSSNTSCPQNICSSPSAVGAIPPVSTELHAAKLQPRNNSHALQSSTNLSYFSSDSFPSADSCLQNRVMPTIHCRDSFSLKSGLENQNLESNQNLAALLQWEKQLRSQMYNEKQINKSLYGSEDNVIASNMESPFCFSKGSEDDNASFHSPCATRRKITGRHGNKYSMRHDDCSFSSLNPLYNEFDFTRFELDSEMQYSTPALFCSSDEDEFIPFKPLFVSQYDPISICSESLLCGPASIQVNTVSKMGELTTPTSVVQHSLTSVSSTPLFCTATSTSSVAPAAVISEQYVPVVESASALMPAAENSVVCPLEESDIFKTSDNTSNDFKSV